jgi:hypothetical protein
MAVGTFGMFGSKRGDVMGALKAEYISTRNFCALGSGKKLIL